MSNLTTSLPAKWRVTTIGSVCSKPQYGWTTSAADSGDVKLLRTTDITHGPVHWSTVPYCRDVPPDVDKYLLAEGDIVVSRAGSVGVSCRVVAPERSVFASYLIRFRPKEDVEGKYLTYVLQSPAYWAQVRGSTAGIAVPNVNASKLEAFDFPLAPLPEQRRIVAEIEKQFTRLEAGVAALRRVQANLKRYRAAVLKAACEGKLVPTEAELSRTADNADSTDKKSRKSASSAQSAVKTPAYETGEELLARILAERRKNWMVAAASRRSSGNKQSRDGSATLKYKEPAAPDTENLPQLPKGWTWANVAQLSFLDIGFAFKSAEFVKSGVRLLRGENLEPGKMRWSDTRYWPESKLDEFRQLLIREGEIVLAMDRPLISSGLKIARARADDLPCLLVQRMAKFRPVVEGMTSFLFTALNSHGFIKHLLGGQTGTQLPHISGDGIQSFPVALPPLAEQTRIVAEVERRLSVVEELEAVVSANLQRAARLRQSILQKGFTGQLLTADSADNTDKRRNPSVKSA